MNTNQTYKLMNPNDIFKKFPKTELSIEKIELGIADDIAKKISDSKSNLDILKKTFQKQNSADKTLINNIKGAVKEADSVASNAIKQRDKALKDNQRIAGILEKAEKAAKDLGVAANGIKGFKELDKLYDDVNIEADKVNSFFWSDIEAIVRSITQ